MPAGRNISPRSQRKRPARAERDWAVTDFSKQAGYLQVDYKHNDYWGHAVRRALDASRSLKERDKRWRSSTLSDLAFSITTRLGALQEIVDMTDTALRVLNDEPKTNLDSFVSNAIAYSFHNPSAVRRAIVLVTMFAAEGDSLFENLAEFYRAFVNHYSRRRSLSATAKPKYSG